MKQIGIIIEFKEGAVKPANLGMLTAARAEGRTLHAILINADPEACREQLEAFGVAHIIALRLPDGTDPARIARAVVNAMDQFGLEALLGLTSPQGRNLLPRIAAILDAPLVMDCIRIDLDGMEVETSQFSGKTIATIQLAGERAVLGIRANAVPPEPRPATAEIHAFTPPDPGETGITLLEHRPPTADAVDLAEADVIISGGRGMKNGENFKILHDCATAMGAAVGASRVAVDEGWVPYPYQVGQTGTKVNPKVYIACGISGSIQHFAGMKTSEMIIAINKDPNAAIVANCDYYIVGDLFEIVPLVTQFVQEGTNA